MLIFTFNYKTSREKFEPELGFEPRTSGFLPGALSLELSWFSCQLMFMRTRIGQVVERRARNPEVQGSNPGSGSNVSLEVL